MPIKKPPYFPFYPKDFTSDCDVESMSVAQAGAYVFLLCKSWQQDKPGTLPNDPELLGKWSRMPDDEWIASKNCILKPFKLGKDGLLHQKRMKKEYAAARKKIRAASTKGRKGGLAKAASTGRAQAQLWSSNQNQNQNHIIPPNPLRGNGWVPNEEQLRLAAMFKRRPQTPWSDKELKAYRAVTPIAPEDMETLERYYGCKIPKASDFRRHDLRTLLNNFTGEIDRARNFKPQTVF